MQLRDKPSAVACRVKATVEEERCQQNYGRLRLEERNKQCGDGAGAPRLYTMNAVAPLPDASTSCGYRSLPSPLFLSSNSIALRTVCVLRLTCAPNATSPKMIIV